MEAVALSNPAFVGSYVDSTPESGVTSEGAIGPTFLDGTNYVAVMVPPASGVMRHLTEFLLPNRTGQSITVSIAINAVIVWTATLQAGDSIQYGKANDTFSVYDQSGGLRNSFQPGPAGPAGPGNVITESSGPTDLAVGAIANGGVLVRSGATVTSIPLSQFSMAQSTGLISGGVMTKNVGDESLLDISETFGQIVDTWTNPAAPVVHQIHHPATVGFLDQNIANGFTSYIAINSAGQLVSQLTEFGPHDRRQLVCLGWADHLDHATIDDCRTEPYCIHNPIARLDDAEEDHGPFNIDGNIFGPTSATGQLKLSRTAGHTHDNGGNAIADPLDPDRVPNEREDPVAFWYYWRDPANPDAWVNNSPLITTVDPNHWDDGTGTLQLVPSGFWTIQLVSFYAQTVMNDIQYGQATYETIEAAMAHLFDPVTLNPYNAPDTFRGWIFLKQGITDFGDPETFRFIEGDGSKFTRVGGGGGGGEGGGEGETNTASNINTAGIGVFNGKNAVDLQFRGVVSVDTLLNVNYNATTKAIELSLNVLNGTSAAPSPTGLPERTIYLKLKP